MIQLQVARAGSADCADGTAHLAQRVDECPLVACVIQDTELVSFIASRCACRAAWPAVAN